MQAITRLRDHRRRRLVGEALEARYCLASVGFATRDIAPVELLSPISQFADVDGDGDLDVLSTGKNGIGWHENTDGKGSFGKLQFIGPTVSPHFSVPGVLRDLDGDNDLDLIAVTEAVRSSADQASLIKLVWYENVDGQGTFREKKVIGTIESPFFENFTDINFTDIRAEDLDGDGDTDVIAAFGSILNKSDGGEIVWYENVDGSGTFGEARVIATGLRELDTFLVEDMDGDGDLDVIAKSKLVDYQVSAIVWYKNVDGSGDFAGPTIIAEASRLIGVDAGDMDGDGDVDVLTILASSYGSAQAIAWYENNNGRFDEPKLVTTDASNVTAILAEDVDSDGDLDVLSASTYSDLSEIRWYENTDGLGGYAEPKSIAVNIAPTDGNGRIAAGDPDADGDLDLLFSTPTDNMVAWYENRDSLGIFGERQVIITATRAASSVGSGDLDGDGDLDVVSTFWTKVVWYENRGDRFGPQNVIFEGDSGERSDRPSLVADMDGDGDLDVISVFEPDALETRWDIVWFENMDGQGTFGEKRVVGKLRDTPDKIAAADLDGDGDLDILAAVWEEVTWYENLDEKGNFDEAKRNVVVRTLGRRGIVAAADMDGDGDLDILSKNIGTIFPGVIWIENQGPGAPNNFRERHEILPGVPDDFLLDVVVSDFDGDGDLDVISAGYETIRYLANTSGTGDFSEEQVIDTAFLRVRDLEASDVDSDGDLDLVASLRFAVRDDDGFLVAVEEQIVWYENTNGMGRFGERQLMRTLDSWTDAIAIADIDRDGDPDVLTASNSGVRWLENRPIGDSNGDGVFDSSDLITVLSAGEYNDDVDRNSSFEEGDWNGDGDFDSSDLVFALQAGFMTP